MSGAAGDGHDGPLVLIVEDDPETRHFYVDALRRRGFRTDDAHNGLQALEKAFTVTPDLVLADIAVPGIDGIELCRRLRADIRTREVPVLAVTGYEDRRYRDRALIAGADRVLIKPCEPDTLAWEVWDLVSHRRVRLDAPAKPA
ncbi:MAG TPA: response regulator [Vicinamibacterales bacterium]|jgi:CheY-like chemotaxis protein